MPLWRRADKPVQTLQPRLLRLGRRDLWDQFDGDHAAGLRRDQLGQHAEARADLQHGVIRGQFGRGDDAGTVGGVNEEVLAQAFLGVDAEGGELV